MSYETSVQAAIYAALTAHAPLKAIVVSIIDDVTQPADSGDSSKFPYVVIGDDAHAEWDTDTELGSTATLTIHSWSRYAGRKQIKQIQGAVYDALHRQNISVSGYHMVGIEWLTSSSFMDSDGLTRHGVQTFRITLEEI